MRGMTDLIIFRFLLNFINNRKSLILRSAGEDDMTPLSRHLEGADFANPSTGACNDGHFAFEVWNVFNRI